MATLDTVYHIQESFRESLPKICRCTDTLGVTLYRTRTVASKMRYIDPNHPNSIAHLVFDIDRPLAVLAHEDRNCPPPSWACINPENGHAHLGYSLASPVHFNPDSSRLPQKYLAAVSVALGNALGADLSYGHGLTKNPLNPYWPTYCFTDLAYDLDSLATHLDLAFDGRRKPVAEGLGRNVTLFNETRFYAYKARRDASQGWLSLDFFIHHLFEVALGTNQGFPQPLPTAEVKGIAKSVGTWTWEHISPQGFRLWGDNRRAKSIRVRHTQSEDRAQRIRELARTFPALTQRELAKLVGLTAMTVNRALKDR